MINEEEDECVRKGGKEGRREEEEGCGEELTGRQTQKQTDRQTYRHTNRHTHRRTDTQTDRQTQTSFIKHCKVIIIIVIIRC